MYVALTLHMATYELFNSHDLIFNSPFQLLHISLEISYDKLVLDQDNNFYLISLSILVTFLLDTVWIL